MLQTHIAISRKSDPVEAAKDLSAQMPFHDAEVVLVFVAPSYDSAALAGALAKAFAPSRVLGCTTSGEISSDGFSNDSVVAIALKAPDLRVGVGLVKNLKQSAMTKGREASLAAISELGLTVAELSQDRHVAMCLIDSRAQAEEAFVAGAAAAIPTVSLVGGSASDVLGEAPRARVFFEDAALKDVGMVVVFETRVPHTVVMSEHMVPTDKRVVVTNSDPTQRLVHEFNGRPARVVYEELVGYKGEEPIDSLVAGGNPLALYVGDVAYVRSIMEVEGDSLRFACAIENGVVLRLVRPGDMVSTTRKALEKAAQEVGGEIGCLVAFNCLGRYLEAEATGLTQGLETEICRYPVGGFQTFGEQINALHMNHTLTALVFGKLADG